MTLKELCKEHYADLTEMKQWVESLMDAIHHKTDVLVRSINEASPETQVIRYFLEGGTCDDVDIDLGGIVYYSGCEALIALSHQIQL